MRTATLAILAIALLAGGCEKANKDRIEKTKTTVISDGDAPRFQLRYEIPEGSTQTLDMIMDMTMSMSGAGTGGMGDVVMPRMIMATDVEVIKVGKDGAMQLSMTTTGVTVEDRPGSMPGVSDAVAGELDAMEGMRMTATLMPNGQTRNLKLDEKSVPASVRDQMRTTEQAMDQMMALLPDVPVGKGARWRVEQTVRQGGMRVNTVSTYEVLEVSETGAVVTAEVSMDAPAQTIEQNGMKVKLEKMTGSGSFSNTLDFSKMVERVEGSLEMDMSMSAMGQSINMTMGLGLQILPRGVSAKPAGDE